MTFHGKSGRFAVRATLVIDTSGDVDVFTAAGCAHEKERVLPWLWFTVGGVEDVPAVIAAGGGVVLRADNREALARARVVYLHALPDVLAARVDADAASVDDRPALLAGGSLAEAQALGKVGAHDV